MRWSDWLVLLATFLSFYCAVWIAWRGEPTRRRTNNLREQMIQLLLSPKLDQDRCIHGELLTKPCPQCTDPMGRSGA